MRFTLEVNKKRPYMLLLMPDAAFELDTAEAEYLLEELREAIKVIEARDWVDDEF